MPSSAIARHELRSERAYAFINMFRANNSGTGNNLLDNHLYTFIGREDNPAGDVLVENFDGSWGLGAPIGGTDLGEWASGLYTTLDGTDDQTPPTAAKTIQMANRFWATAIAGKKVAPADIHMMIPRINWVSGTTYNVRPASGPEGETWYSAASPDNDFYVLNSEEEVWMLVAKRVDEVPPTATAATTSTVEPKLSTGGLTNDTTFLRDGKASILGADASGVPLLAGDGYVWKYMFKLTATLINNLLLDDWIPVPCTEDTLWPSVSETALLERTRGRDDSYLYLGARHVMIRSELTAGADTTGLLPSGLRYRQAALVKNPISSTGTFVRATDPVVFQRNSVNIGSIPADQIQPFSGDIIYLENRSPIAREVNQTEEFKTIFVF